jgi:carbon storage regulator CsrA
MLVLTRRPNDRILFPRLGIAIHVVRVDGRSVRLGIEAPRDVHIVRHELADQHSESAPSPEPPALSHAFRNRLQTSLLTLQLLQRQIELDQIEPGQIERQLGDVIAQLESLESGAALPASKGPATSRASAHHDAGRHPRRTALLVEDNPNERALLAGYLQSFDYDVATAGDGADALEYLATHDKPDVVLLDMNMPRIGGAATVQVIRSNPGLAGVKLVAVSGLAPRQANVPVGKDGVDRWFTKPIRPDLLVEQLDRELAESVPA